MKIQVFVRGMESKEGEFLTKIMAAADIQKWDVIDVLVQDLDKLQRVDIGIALGTVCGRLVKEHVKQLFVLPSLKQLQPYKKNEKHRQEAWDKLQEIKAFLENSQTATECSWKYATVCMPGQKKIVIYEEERPAHVDGDVFISRKDSNMLLKLKEAFRAEAVVIGEEAE